MKLFTGTRKYATERMAQIAVSSYSKELRAMWAALALIRGISFNAIERSKTSPHPLYSIIDKINEYKVKYGYAPTEAPKTAQSNKSSGTSANKSSGTSSGKSDKNIYDVIVGGKKLLE